MKTFGIPSTKPWCNSLARLPLIDFVREGSGTIGRISPIFSNQCNARNAKYVLLCLCLDQECCKIFEDFCAAEKTLRRLGSLPAPGDGGKWWSSAWSAAMRVRSYDCMIASPARNPGLAGYWLLDPNIYIDYIYNSKVGLMSMRRVIPTEAVDREHSLLFSRRRTTRTTSRLLR